MALLSVANVDEYRKEYAEALAAQEEKLGAPISNELITEKIYGVISQKADVDYFSFYKAFNPDGKYSNIDSFRETIKDKDLNDTEIINKAYGELQNTGKVRFKDFVNTFAPKEEDLSEAVKRDFNIIGLNIPDVEYSVKEIAEMRGVNPDTDVGLAEIGFAQSLARNDANEVLASKKVLSDYFGQEIPLRYGPETEELEFLNPKTGDYELLNKPGIDAGDMAKFGSTAAVIVPEIVATIFATGATGPTGGVITSAATSAALETARLALGHQLYGINQTEKGFTDYLKNEGKDMAVLNGALTTAGFTVPKLYRMIKQFRNMGKINASDFGGTIKNAEQAQELITKINDRLITLGTKKKLKFTLGQAGDDAELLALQNAYESNPKYGVKGIFDSFNKEQAEALDTFFLLASDPYNYKGISGKDNILSDELGKKIQNVILQRLEPRQKILTKALEAAETDLTEAVIKLPGGSQKEAGQSIRGVIDTLYKDFDELYDQKYTTLFATGKGRKVGTDIIREAVKSLNKRQKDTLFKKYPDIKTFFNAPKGKTVSVNTLKNTLSDLRKFDRSIKKGTLPIEGEPVEGAVSKLIGSIKEQFKKSLGQDDVWYKQFRTLDQEYATNKKLYRGTIGKLLQTKDGVLKIADEDVFAQTFKKGAGQEMRIDQIYELLKRKPEFIQTYKDSILKSYKTFVDPADTGKINLVKHQKFLNDYKYALETFFGKKGYKEITKVGNLAKKVNETSLKRDKIMKQLGTTTKGKLENMDPDKIFQYLYNNKSPTTLNKVMTIIRQDDNLLKAFQTVAKDDLMFKATNNRGQFVFDKFADYMKNNKQILERTFADNPQYVKDLSLFRDALEVTTRKSTQKTISKAETALNDIIRARLGQFTVAGRTFTALKKIFRSDIDRQLAEIMTDPKKLDQLLSLKNVKTTSDTAKQTISRLFGYYMFDEKFFEDDEYSPLIIDAVNNTKVSEAVIDAQEGDDPVELAELEGSKLPLNLTASTAAPGAMPPMAQPQGIAGVQSRQNYEAMFPDDALGTAISKRGIA